MSLEDRIIRALDVGIASVALVASIPVLAAAYAAMQIGERIGPPFGMSEPFIHAQERYGRNGEIFRMYKIRTLRYHAPPLSRECMSDYDGRGPFPLCPTSIGRFLQRTKINEIPQLWNVVKGEMSLVGHRPPIVTLLPDLDTHSAEWLRLRNESGINDIRPGMTGPVQLVDEDLPLGERVAMEREFYLQRDVRTYFRAIRDTALLLYGRCRNEVARPSPSSS